MNKKPKLILLPNREEMHSATQPRYCQYAAHCHTQSRACELGGIGWVNTQKYAEPAR